ncbi:MAG: hypothetical protein K0R80_983 [Clostridia bacterium]|jgi:hypothetical protein|nr:hypothetical protein [Clostridia bacterium]
MKLIEEMLNNSKIEIEELQVPDELEARLNSALQNKRMSKKRNNNWSIKVAVLLIAFMLVTYNIDTLAFYGRELLGFDNILNGTLKELNKMGMGQTIEKSHTFSNGIKVTLNGVMLDDNQLLAFYTIQNTEGSAEDVFSSGSFNSMYVQGILGRNYLESGQGQLSEDKSVIRWVEEFEPPHAFEKKLTWVFNIFIDGKSEEGKISFVLDRDKAMGHTLKSRLNQNIKLEGSDIRFDTITASPTTTVVKGTVQNIIELASDKISGERIFSPNLDIKLLANDKEIDLQGGGMSTDMKGMKFEKRYDALPQNLEKLQLHLVSFGAEHEVSELISLDRSLKARTIKVSGQDIIIEKLEERNGETFVTITTEESVLLSKVYLMVDNHRVELTETIDDNYDKKKDGTITKTRTLRFETAAEDLQLEIKRIRYQEAYDEYVNIPID